MTALSFKLNRNIYFIITTAITIFIGGAFLLHIVPAVKRDKIADGLLADFVITFPVLYYFIIIRPLKKQLKSLILVISVCCLGAYLILPQQQKDYVLQIRKLTALAELGFIIYVITRFNKLNKSYKIHQATMADPIYNLRSAMADILGESLPVKIIASELAVLRYGLLFWRQEKSTLKESTTFSTHKEAGYIAIWCIMICAISVEMVAFHLLLMRWSHLAANIVTALTLYGSILVIADLSAILKRKVMISNQLIIFQTGLRWRAITRLDNISSIKKVTNDQQPENGLFLGGILKKNGNLLITFKEPVQVEKLYGSGKMYSSLLMNIDDFEGFAEVLGVSN